MGLRVGRKRMKIGDLHLGFPRCSPPIRLAITTPWTRGITSTKIKR